ncbi:villin/gelsolin repeat protein [Fadolivirus algeromassiliense]|jgi:gelsolin|uniref:Villin/gelsolin repeat protein n=1 Tax=Fadolivirus FV1/VV64 TaxID=3070911 RepID=A0A7D3QVR6_9VIRU|nr:villin/gelsolin repeat protein [Fadolivirus algeromassiliense]QKF94584.1 villin/gelsolin repeat protein [Fadolivirus FV1/VV64]
MSISQKNDHAGTNLELFGTEFERKIKEESSKHEPVWKNININDPKLHIWRVEQFKLVPVNENLYGTFYEGDSYVILNIYKNSNDSLCYNIHFWLGGHSSQDEIGVAAYKTVELDTYLNDKAIQYREVQGFESDLFRSYFTQGLTYKIGGVESGFHHVQVNDYFSYQPILLRIHNNSVMQVPLIVQSITRDDVYVLDCGLTVYVYRGPEASHKEHYLAQTISQKIKNNRQGCNIFNVENENTYEVFMTYIKLNANEFYNSKRLFKIKEENNVVQIEKVDGTITYSSFNSDDSFVFDTCFITYIWIGKNSSYNETLNAWKVAFRTTNPATPIALVRESNEPELFKMNF